MSEPVWKREEPDSPCDKICVMHPVAEICIGCLRTSAEIASWSHLSKAERYAVLDELPDRQIKLKGKRRVRKRP